ncbi:MAG: hypothetical protein B7Y45_10855 [Sphingomonas sp. 28-66-16]|nr:MAG: hypothetical protein B7Y45_10855 [Sphingomonas sp. 28-66-16]
MKRRVPYSQVGLQVLIVSILAHAAQIALQTGYPFVFAINIASLFYMRWRAGAYLRAGRADFDPVIAAEMIVAFGVLSLILGISTAVVPLFLGTATLRVGDLTALATLATPFLEGLATAGLAPFFAVLLRIEAHEIESRYDSSTDMSSLATATRDLTRTIRGTHTALSDLQESARAASVSTKALADEVRGEAGRLNAAFMEGEARLRTLTAAAESSGTEVAKLAGETTRLTNAATDAGTMLTALGDLIESVERFVKPTAPAE